MFKRHGPEFGVVTLFFVDKRHCGLHWYYYSVFVEALAVLSCSGRSIFAASDCFGSSYFLIFRLSSCYGCLSQTTAGGAYRFIE